MLLEKLPKKTIIKRDKMTIFWGQVVWILKLDHMHSWTKMSKQIAAAKSIQKNSVPWAEFTIALSRLVPNGVVVNSLKFDSAAGNRSAINGQANTRETLLAFESRLKEAPFVEKVDLPFKNKQEKMNIYFTITLTIKPEAAPPLN